MSFIKQFSVCSLLPAAVALAIPFLALAQNQPAGPPVPQAQPQTSAGSRSTVPSSAGFLPNPYYPVYQWQSPAGSYLQGASSVISAQGQFLIDKRQGDIVREQAEQAKLDTRRKAIEQWQFEQSIQPSVADIRAKQAFENLQQMRGTPADAQIWSGEALNAMLRNIQQLPPQRSRKPSIPLDPEMVARINVTDGTTSGSLGQLGKTERTQWPFALRAPEFKDGREQIDRLMGEAKGQARNGDAQFETVRDIQRSVERMQEELKNQIKEMTPNDYIQSLRFLRELGSTARALGESNAADLVSGKWQPEASTVDQLIAAMTKRGVHFAPARKGDEAAYTSLYHSLRAFDMQTSELVAGQRPQPQQ